MPRVAPILGRARKAIKDLDLLKILDSELNYELSSVRYQDEITGAFGDFLVDWDSEKFEDVIWRKKCSSGEEVAVSALLSHDFLSGGRFPREALLKICVKKPSLSSILLFDCVASNRGDSQVVFDVQKVNCLPTASFPISSVYSGPVFSDLDPALQHELKRYLAARGIGDNFTNSLLLHLHKKEQDQYMAWLQKLKDAVAE